MFADYSQRLTFGRIDRDDGAIFVQNIDVIHGIKRNLRRGPHFSGSIFANFLQIYPIAAESLYTMISSIGDKHNAFFGNNKVLGIVQFTRTTSGRSETEDFLSGFIQLRKHALFFIQCPKSATWVNGNSIRRNIIRLDFRSYVTADNPDDFIALTPVSFTCSYPVQSILAVPSHLGH